MRLLVVTQYFHPEEFPINHVCEALAARVTSVTVLTGQPNYPGGTVFEGFRAAGFGDQTLGKVSVLRVPLMPRGKGGGLRLMLNYLSFIASASLFGPFRLRGQSFDAVLVYAPSPLLQAIPAVFIKWLKRAPLAVWVQDLWPESLSATGFVKNRTILSAVERCVRWIYRHTDLVLAQSEEFVTGIARYAPGRPIEVHYNSVAPSLIANPQADVGECPVPALTEPTFNVVFAGNLGKAQGLDVVLDAAARLRDNAAIRIFLIGSGSDSERLATRIRDEGLTNVVMPGRFPYQSMPAIFQHADALLVVLRSDPVLDLTIPSKLGVYLATGRPIIASLNGAGARVVAESGGGMVCAAQDAGGLEKAISDMAAMAPEERTQMGVRGRDYYARRFEAGKLADDLSARLNKLSADHRVRGPGK
ncbi:glycosyltransferase [Pandoraea captiosa]|uniref:Glycosyltransferase n=1 Tax=Pandoraea captiosa TaxID=2508302 RepID=A0A5E5ACF2_9BURK|nr:glycosyltransferase family 4 protein [Pandoraea captiosa]VVE70858.1 glycosyltransferase [Pandoraea captiosa]